MGSMPRPECMSLGHHTSILALPVGTVVCFFWMASFTPTEPVIRYELLEPDSFRHSLDLSFIQRHLRTTQLPESLAVTLQTPVHARMFMPHCSMTALTSAESEDGDVVTPICDVYTFHSLHNEGSPWHNQSVAIYGVDILPSSNHRVTLLRLFALSFFQKNKLADQSS